MTQGTGRARFNMRCNIAITGMGAVTPLGTGAVPLWAALRQGISGIGDITAFDTSGFKFTRAGQVGDREIAGDCDAQDPAERFILAAAKQAMAQATDRSPPLPRARTGVVLSTNFGTLSSGESLLARSLGEETPKRENPGNIKYQSTADLVAKQWQLNGPRAVLSLSCASGAAALCYAADLLSAGRADAIIVGGYDALSRIAWSGLSALRTMTRDEIRPFDLKRAGTIFSEGAGAVVLEKRDHARRRGATIYAELLGWATNNNAFHMTAPSKMGAGTAEVMRSAIEHAGLEPSQIDHINAHGTGTRHNDSTETDAIKTVFGAQASTIPITSIKSSIGHLMGAAGSIEAIATIMSTNAA